MPFLPLTPDSGRRQSNAPRQYSVLADFLAGPVDCVSGIGPQASNRLATAGIRSVADLLMEFPLRYQDRTHRVAIANCPIGDDVQIDVRVIGHKLIYGRKRMLQIQVFDESGELSLRYFHFFQSQLALFTAGNRLLCFGRIRAGRGNKGLEMVHPTVQKLADQAQPVLPDHLSPVYSQREGLPAALPKWIRAALKLAGEYEDQEYLPPQILRDHGFPSFLTAVNVIHYPSANDADALLNQCHPAQRRLAFEEILAHQWLVRQNRQQRADHAAPVLACKTGLREQFSRALPFTLTPAQQQVMNVIGAELGQNAPMMRLVQGDVGCGKTMVAAFAMLQCATAGKQAALMAPTEILAEQHFRHLKPLFEKLGFALCILTGKSRDKAATRAALAGGQIPLCVGTHALFQSSVRFADLALIIVDEQQRFGVQQRLALLDKGRSGDMLPHQLIMSATPIPRSLAMALYADLDHCIIDSLPPGRQPVQTVALPEQRRDEVIARVGAALKNEHQVYWVCPHIEQSDEQAVQAVEHTVKRLQQSLHGISLASIHGRMPSRDKERIMNQFAAGKYAVLVATTVIEVGVDVPGATLMIIENAERLGLSQLHQLRGRIGRGDKPGVCVLLYQPPLNEVAVQRIDAMRRHHDGFTIAEKDLQLRGPGELLGQRQTGAMPLRIADLARHTDLLQQAVTVVGGDLNTLELSDLCRRWLDGHNPDATGGYLHA